MPELQWDLNWGGVFLGCACGLGWGSPPIPLTLMEEDSSNPEERDEDREVLRAIHPGENQRRALKLHPRTSETG